MNLVTTLATRMRRMLSRAVLDSTDDSGKGQRVKLTSIDGEVIDQAEHWQPYGFTQHAPAGGEALLVSLGGDRAHSVVISVADRRYRVHSLAAGEVAIHDDQGQQITLYRDRVEIAAPKGLNIIGDTTILGTLTFTGNGTMTGNLSLIGDLDVTGEITATKEVTADTIALTTHVHSGVTPGGGNTAEPVP